MNNLKELYQLLKSDSIDIDAIELAESLWLSKYISKTKQPSTSDNDNGSHTFTKERDELKLPPIDHTPPPTNSKVKQLKEKKREDKPLHPISDKDNKNSLPFRTPLVRKLYKDNDLIFAFRDFRQKIVSLKKSKLNEEKIADYIAKTDIFRPFYKKSYEKRFRVLFMVDSSESMKIWESLIDDFIISVKSYHIFKEVMVCYISTNSQEPQFFKKKELTSLLNDRWYREIDSNTIAFMFSDMMSKSWSSGVLLEQMTLWQNHFPFALVQMLPQRLWNGTKLIDASMGKMSSHKKFALNSQIVSLAEEILAREEEKLPELVKIPLLNFNPSSIEAYGKIMRSLPNNRIEGALFEEEDFRGEYQLAKENSKLNAEQRLRGFYKYASREAKELLELLAVVPLSLPIIKLIQQKLLPHSTQEHLSEVFMSSIIDKEQKVDGFYQFSKYEDEESGVREELIKKIGARQAFQTIVKLSEVIQKQGGVFDFLAFVVDPDSLKQSDEFSEIDREFARISVAVLREMGGEYFAFADRLVEWLEGVDDEIEVVIPKSKRFMMGAEDSEDTQPVHKVILNYDFEIGKYPVTVGEFRQFIKATGYLTEAEKGNGAIIWNKENFFMEKTDAFWNNPYFKQTERNPVVCITINDILVYIDWLNKQTNQEYKLPTEEEWEFVCKSINTEQLNDELKKYAWYDINSNGMTHPIGLKKTTSWGIHDMLGNVWECCDNNQVRGGSWGSPNYRVSPSLSNSKGIILCDNKMGFRLLKYMKKEKFNNKTINISKPKMIKIQNSLSIDTIKIPNRNYEMGKYPITIAEYMHFVRDTDSHYPRWIKERDKYKNMNLTDNAPIIGVSWYDAVAYCEWLSEKTGKIYKLPSTGVWGECAKAGTTTKWSFGDDESLLGDYAWYRNNSNGTTHVVGEKLPNPWGLYDMYGNVYEWSSLSHQSEYQYLFGGSWYHDSSYTFSKKYLNDDADRTSGVAGFRILRDLEEERKIIQVSKIKKIEKYLTPKISKNSFFVGRDKELKEISDLIESQKGVILRGTGGIGKTSLISEYLIKNEKKYKHIAYIPHYENLEEDFIKYFSESLEVKNKNIQEIMLKLKELQTNKIMVIDGVTDNIQNDGDYLNELYLNGWRIILLTREDKLNILIKTDYQLGGLSKESSKHLLLHYRMTNSIEDTQYEKLFELLSYHPLNMILILKQKSSFNEIVDAILSSLPEREKAVIRMRFGLLGEEIIETQIDGDFNGWEGETIVKLMNGEIWQQSEYHYDYSYSFMPEVKIIQSDYGYKMEVEGSDRAVGVVKLSDGNSIGGSSNFIESKIDGEFNGWDGETIVKLINGQVWKQSRYAYSYSYKYMPKVTIYKTGSNYKMKVDGNRKEVYVERIK